MSETWQSPKQICTHANLALRGEVCLEERRSFSVAISDPHFAAPKLEGEEVGPTDVQHHRMMMISLTLQNGVFLQGGDEGEEIRHCRPLVACLPLSDTHRHREAGSRNLIIVHS